LAVIRVGSLLLLISALITIYMRRRWRHKLSTVWSRARMDPRTSSTKGNLIESTIESKKTPETPNILNIHPPNNTLNASPRTHGEASSFYETPVPPAYAISTPSAPLPSIPLFTNMPAVPPSPTLSLDWKMPAAGAEAEKENENEKGKEEEKEETCSYTTYLRHFPNEPGILEQGQIIKGRGTRRHVRIIGATSAGVNDTAEEAARRSSC
jgi:hypothetical protein